MESVMERRTILKSQLVIPLVALLSVSSLVGCKTTQHATTTAKVEQQEFASPDAAGAALLAAAASENEQEIDSIFGPGSNSVISSGDAATDKQALQGFVKAYNQMHRWRAINAGGEILITGAENRPFPIPLGKNSSGQWVFDTAAGKDEMLARRVGNDEITAIEACQAIAHAQNQYFQARLAGDPVRQYAQKFVSDEGKTNGLFWAAVSGSKPSPLGDAQDFALAVGGGKSGQPQAYEGYYFVILTKGKSKIGTSDYLINGQLTGGFAVLAYPAKYRDSGIMTFVAGKDGVVYEKDLGDQTSDAAKIVTAYDPSDGWRPTI